MVKNKKALETQIISPKVVVDGENAILGRLCSEVAKYLLEGYIVSIVNCEKAIISGKKQSILNEYRDMHKKHTHTNPRRGPFHPKRPDRLVRRTVRGMLPWKKSRGRDAFHRLYTHIGVPDDLSKSESIKIEHADFSKLTRNYVKIGDLCKEFGWQE